MNVNRDSWRAITFEYLRKKFEKREGQFEQVNAGIGATGSIFGTFRLAKDILAYKPDFLFIEFAVNDNGDGTENDPTGDGSIYRTYRNIIDRVRAANPDVAICITLSANRPKDVENAFAEKLKADVSRKHTERAANYFKIPYIRIMDVYYSEPLPEGLSRDRLFDGPESLPNAVHPSQQGHRAYAEGVIRGLEKIFATYEFPFIDVQLDEVKL